MKKPFSMLAAACLLASSFSMPAAAAGSKEEIKGSLVIAGGSLGSSNQAVYESFIDRAGGKENGRIGIIPAASGKLKSSNEFKADLVKYGVRAENIDILPISNHDFSDTDFDESKWKNNVSEKEIINQIEDLSAVWFVGGDQLKITDTLFDEKGKNTKALDAIWDIYRDGAVLGGTSAGAAIMSDVMITGGDSLGGLKGEFTEVDKAPANKEYAPVYIEKGLGFFQYGIVDQHFDERARLGRLAAAAVKYEKQKEKFHSYGIDEDTALIVDNKAKTAEIAGRGGVTVVDAGKAKPASKKLHPVNNVSISFLSPGDKIDLKTKAFSVNPDKDETKGYEYYSFKPLEATGILTSYGRLKPYLSYSLIDNSSTESVKSYLYDSKGKGFALTFSKTDETNGYWGYQDGQKDDYSITNALGGGVFPISCVAANKDILGVFNPGSHGSTFGGNPLACAVSVAALQVLEEEKLSERSLKLGAYFKEKLAEINNPLIKEVRGRGLFIGVELTVPARPYCEKLKDEGLLCKETHETVIRFAPPLVISEEDLEWAIEKITRVLSE